MVVPEDSVPAAAFGHPCLPGTEQALQLHEVKRRLSPLFPVLVVDLQMVEGEDHGQLLFLRVGVADAVGDSR